MSGSVFAQEMGFGCFGLVGGFVGYGVQQYTPGGINAYINDVNEFNKGVINVPLSDFKQMQGFRVGANVFRNNYSGFIITAKGFYQLMSEKQEVRFNDAVLPTIHSFEMRVKEFAIGLDLGMEISKKFHWKVLDLTLMYNIYQFKTQSNSVKGIVEAATYQNPEVNIEYTLGTGFVYYVVEKYISVEGSFGITSLTANTLRESSGNYLKLLSSSKVVGSAIQSGGLSALIQLNISLPM